MATGRKVHPAQAKRLLRSGYGSCDVFMGEDGRRTAKDFAACLDHITNALPEADKIVLVMDNLNAHNEASLYEAFPPAKACELCQRFEFEWTEPDP